MPQIFDVHLHIIDPRFPLIENRGFVPEPFSVADYRQRVSDLPVVGGTVVSGSFQGFDQEYLVVALQELGEGFVGVTQLPASVTDEEILHLDAAGVRGVRFNLFRGGSEQLDHLENMAHRVHELAGWHVELYVDSAVLPQLKSRLLRFPAYSIDHLGMSLDGFDTLLELVEAGAMVKACGFGRVEFDIVEVMRQLLAVNPLALMFATDLPSTIAKLPFNNNDIKTIIDNIDDSCHEAIFQLNAQRFYRLKNQAITIG
ncbi:2-pyrone-4,6-dicarboxylate hydrolase [Solemya velum gill symbiont]|uniref:amidohydrolase family protein n=1 Tax=Solemya velum gill symbiont TaxID=2340 RepID=UPI000996AD7A|nr:amidohydrolase family protein [Solemya velum gill symbiont]OOZ15693.1 2-pyrone-4,6-dicarboxylate hydrolase [Solemya velum gill symbiont]OOZ20505.1 2-pyrone-4,6-dicarboxylate hydrolase [Solemya velum gill symbiont]OOZ22378.1 2-pyrone-4,6-dicarboxylate hydrolase [Solemya velum gill symbiont]OOZ24655.1 2-pyrone-4,6-dicarboxylate hydrolase [Solemya velum gill symbiont]OOZ30149.1 2-pyrone-4,6-dicarboxylate hydrolase [Solemya velum gill symbiont]